MKKLELNLDKIQSLGLKREEENFEFRSFLKSQEPERIDKIVQPLNKEITERIDCTTCGNCCHHLRPLVSVEEIKKLSQIDNLSTTEFTEKHTEKMAFEKDRYLKATPCKYLKDKKCSIYADRPEDCRSYPHTHKSNFTQRTFGLIDNYSICPIVFNLFERLKEELNFKH